MWVRKAEGEGGARVDGLLAFIVLEINKTKLGNLSKERIFYGQNIRVGPIIGI